MTDPTAGGFLRSLLLKPVSIRNLRPLLSVTSNGPIIPLNLPFPGKISTTVASVSCHGLSLASRRFFHCYKVNQRDAASTLHHPLLQFHPAYSAEHPLNLGEFEVWARARKILGPLSISQFYGPSG